MCFIVFSNSVSGWIIQVAKADGFLGAAYPTAGKSEDEKFPRARNWQKEARRRLPAILRLEF
jgi:hypothetical protein